MQKDIRVDNVTGEPLPEWPSEKRERLQREKDEKTEVIKQIKERRDRFSGILHPRYS